MPLSDLFIATTDEVRRLSPEDTPLYLFPSVEAKGIQAVQLATLQCILTGTPPEVDLVVNIAQSFDLVREVSDDGPWIHRVPEPLAVALANIDGDHISAVAIAWANTEELRHSDPVIIENGLKKIVDLARQANAEKKEMFMWNSL